MVSKHPSEMTDKALLAEYNRPAPKCPGTYKVERRRAIRFCRVRDELARRGLVESSADFWKRIGGAA